MDEIPRLCGARGEEERWRDNLVGSELPETSGITLWKPMMPSAAIWILETGGIKGGF
jgi:hypothetical protein